MSKHPAKVVIKTGQQMLEEQAQTQREIDIAEAVGTLDYVIDEVIELVTDSHISRKDMRFEIAEHRKSIDAELQRLKDLLGVAA